MRSGITLATLRKEVMIEAGFSTETGHAVHSAERLRHLLQRTERVMATMDDWPGIHFEEEVAVSADAQYVTLPTNISFTEIDTVHVAFGDEWLPVTQGIGAMERSVYDDTQRATPIRRWEVTAGATTTFEVWPIGATAQTLLFTGAKKLGAFVDDDDTCTLDADVLVLRVAAEILGRDRKEDAALKLETARTLTNQITKKQGVLKRGNINLGRRRTVNLRPGIDYIAPGSV